MSKISDNAHYYVAGAGLYYALSWVFTFYPAFVIGLFACQNTDPDLFDPHIAGLIIMIIGYIVIQILIALEKYVAVGIIYLLTAWSFIHQVYWYFIHLDSGPAGTDECFPLPAVDWLPFF